MSHQPVAGLPESPANKSDDVKAATFLHLAGPEALEVFNTLSFDNPGDEKKLDKLVEKFEAYCIPRKNVTWERHVFNTRNQQPGESVDQYVTDLRKKAKTCEFGILTESLIKDGLVCGAASDKTRSRLLKQADLTLSKAMDICRADEAALAQLKSMATRPPSTASSEDVDVQLLKTRRQTQHYRQQSQCTYCGGWHHARQKCPAAGVQCHKCGRRNHFARVCRSGTQSSRQKVHEIHDEQGDSSEEELLVAAIEDGPPRKDWSATVTINAHHVTFKIDTGAQCNVMSYATFSRISQ